MNMFTIYLLTMLDNICTLFEIMNWTFALLTIAIAIFYNCGTQGADLVILREKSLKPIIISVLFFIISVLCYTATPTTKQMCAIYVIPKIANNEQIQNIGDKSLTLIEKKFEEWVNDTIETKETK